MNSSNYINSFSGSVFKFILTTLFFIIPQHPLFAAFDGGDDSDTISHYRYLKLLTK